MKKLFSVVFLFVLLSLAGCIVPYYLIRVNGYTKQTINFENQKVFLFINPNANAQNPFLEEEIGNKLKKALAFYKIKTVDNITESNLILTFNYGIDNGQTQTEISSGSDYQLNIHTGKFDTVSSTSSNTFTLYTSHLILKLFTTNGLNENSKPIWYQEVKSKGTNSDLRTVINYLIAGAFEHLGQDTKGEVINTYYSYDGDPTGGNSKKFIKFINTN